MNHLLLLLSLALHPDTGWTVLRSSPIDSAAYYAFVDALADAWTPAAMADGFDSTRAGPWDVPRILSLVSADGLDFYDANTVRSWHTSRSALAAELRARSGRSYAMLLHLGYIRADRPEVSITGGGEGVQVDVAGWYQVSLTAETGQLKATRVEYLEVEDE